MDEIKTIEPKVEIKTEQAIVEDKPVEEPEKPIVTVKPKSEEEVEKLIPQEPYQTSPLFYKLAEYFELSPKDYNSVADKLSIIADWAITKMRTNKTSTILNAIQTLEGSITKPTWGESRYANLYRYLRLQQLDKKGGY